MHGKCKRRFGLRWRRGQLFQDLQQARACVVAPIGGGLDHVVPDECRDGNDRRDLDTRGLGKYLKCVADIGKGHGSLTFGFWFGSILQRVELVHGKDNAWHPQQVHQQGVTPRLRQQFQRLVFPIKLGGIDQHHCGIGAGRGGDHVAGVLLMARRVTDDEFSMHCIEVAVGHVDRDTLFTFGAQAVGEQGQISCAAFGNVGQLVLQD